MEEISAAVIKEVLEKDPDTTAQELVLTLKEHWLAYIHQVFERESDFIVSEYVRTAAAIVNQEEIKK